MKEEPCDCLACMIPASECQICRESKLESERNRAIAERDAAEQKLSAIREAARALVDALESTHGDWPRFCDEPRCCCLAMHDDGDQVACDEHQGILVDGEVEDLSYAPALRTLRQLLEQKP